MIRRIILICLIATPVFAQSKWTEVRSSFGTATTITGTYTPSNAVPNGLIGQQPAWYDYVDQSIMAYWPDAACAPCEWGNGVFLYNDSNDTFSLAWDSLNAEINGNGSVSGSNIVSVSGNGTTATVTLTSAGARYISGGASGTAVFQLTGFVPTTWNGQVTMTGSTCSGAQPLCTVMTFPSSINGSPTTIGAINGPAETSTNPYRRHTEGSLYAHNTSPTRDAFYMFTGIGDISSGPTNILYAHTSVDDGYALTFGSPVASHWAWTEICGFGTVWCEGTNSNSSSTPVVTSTSGDGIPCNTGSSSGCGYKFPGIGYDPTNDVIIFFGGQWNSTNRNETLAYYPAHGQWFKVNADTPSVTCSSETTLPCARWFQGDSRMPAIGGGKLLLFGSQNNASTNLNDTWEFSTVAYSSCSSGSCGSWTKISSTNNPPTNGFPILDYDAAIPGVIHIDNQSPSHVWAFCISAVGFCNNSANQWVDKTAADPTHYGSGPTMSSNYNQTGAFNVHTNNFVVFTKPSSNTQIWTLALPASAPAVTILGPIGIQAAEAPGGCNGTCVTPQPSTNRGSTTPLTVGIPLDDSLNIACDTNCSGTPLGFTASASKLVIANCSTSVPISAQFRVESLWPDTGNVQWVLADIQDSLSLATLDAQYCIGVTTGTGGNTGSAMGGTCTGAGTPDTICRASGDLYVNTTSADYDLRPGNDRVFEIVKVGSTSLVTSAGHGTNDGLVLMGPSHTVIGTGGIDSVSCNPGPPPTNYAGTTTCATPYLSSADASSTCAFLDNGNMRTVTDCKGDLNNSNGDTYMHWERICTFWSGHADAKCDVALRNADLATSSNVFKGAYKEFASLEERLTPAGLATGTRSLTFGDVGTASTTTSLTAGTGDAYIYQGYSNQYEWSDWAAANCTALGDECVVSPLLRAHSGGNCTDSLGAAWTYYQCGYQINSTAALTGTTSGAYTAHPSGWAMEADSSSNTVEFGLNYFSANPGAHALEMFSGGNEIRIGLFPDQTLFSPGNVGVQTYAQRWPAYSIQTEWFNFIAATSTSATVANDTFIEEVQAPLLGRTPIPFYANAQSNTTSDPIMVLNLIDPVAEDTYWQTVQQNFVPSNCTPGACLDDVGGSVAGQGTTSMYVYPSYIWANGGSNQLDAAWSDIRKFLGRGCTPSSGVCGALAITGSTPGLFLRGQNFYRNQVAQGSIPRSDFGGWRSSSACASPPCTTLMGKWGYPDKITSWNGGMRQWEDEQNGEDHLHTDGIIDYEFLTGDPWVYQQLQAQGYADLLLNTGIAYNNPAMTGAGALPGHQQYGVIRAAGHWMQNLAREAMFLCSIRDSSTYSSGTCQTSVLAGAENTAAYSILAPAYMDGYPTNWPIGSATTFTADSSEATCSSGSSNTVSPCSGGQNPVLGFAQSGITNSTSSDDCTISGNYLPCDGNQHWVVKPFMEALAQEGLYVLNQAERSFRGLHWSTTVTVAHDGSNASVPVTLCDECLTQSEYGMGTATLKSSIINNGTIAFSGIVYDTFPSYLNGSGGTSSTGGCFQTSGAPNCSRICDTTGDCTFGGQNYWNFFSQCDVTNGAVDLDGTSFQTFWNLYIGKAGSGVLSEWESPEMQAVEGCILNGGTTLADVPLTSANTGSGGSSGANITLTWAAPTSLTPLPVHGSTYRLNYYSYPTSGGTQRAIKNWLQFYPNCTLTYRDVDSHGNSLCPVGPPAGSLAASSSGSGSLLTTGYWAGGQTPDVNQQWFSSTPVTATGLQSPTCTAGVCSYTFSMSANTSYVFDLKVYGTPGAAPSTNPISIPYPGPFASIREPWYNETKVWQQQH